MPKISYVIVLCLVPAGCTGTWQSGRAPGLAAIAANKPAVYPSDQLSEIPSGRFCRIISSRPGTAYEGTVVRSTTEGIVLTETVALIPKSPAMKALPRLLHFLNPGAELEIPDGEVTIDRDQIDSIQVYEESDSLRLGAQQAEWIESQRRVREQLTTTPEFPSSG